MDWSKYYPANYTAITPEDIEMIKELKQNPPVEEDASNDKSDDGEGMDKVDPKELKRSLRIEKTKTSIMMVTKMKVMRLFMLEEKLLIKLLMTKKKRMKRKKMFK